MSLTVGSLFSGVGLLDFGLEQAGMETIWQVEYDDWCREVALPQNFPDTEKFNDVRTVGKHNLRAVDVICGGFPCQDLSIANKHGENLQGAKSGLWSEMFRVICELRPKYIVIENVSKLVVSGLEQILCAIASIGYDAEWKVLSSVEFKLFNPRKRLFVVAYPQSKRNDMHQVFKEIYRQSLHHDTTKFYAGHQARICLDVIGRSYPEIPEHLRMAVGRTFELSEIERAVKAYGNGVAIPVAKFIGEQIIRFDREINE